MCMWVCQVVHRHQRLWLRCFQLLSVAAKETPTSLHVPILADSDKQ